REPGQRISCVNNLRRLGTAALMYSSENDGQFPPRQIPFWPTRLLRYYKDLSVLRCPNDNPTRLPPNPNPADEAPRSYLMNGWDDYWQTTLAPQDYDTFISHRW